MPHVGNSRAPLWSLVAFSRSPSAPHSGQVSAGRGPGPAAMAAQSLSASAIFSLCRACSAGWGSPQCGQDAAASLICASQRKHEVSGMPTSADSPLFGCGTDQADTPSPPRCRRPTPNHRRQVSPSLGAPSRSIPDRPPCAHWGWVGREVSPRSSGGKGWPLPRSPSVRRLPRGHGTTRPTGAVAAASLQPLISTTPRWLPPTPHRKP